MEELVASLEGSDARERPELADRLIVELQQIQDIPQLLLGSIVLAMANWIKSSNIKASPAESEKQQRRKEEAVCTAAAAAAAAVVVVVVG